MQNASGNVVLARSKIMEWAGKDFEAGRGQGKHTTFGTLSGFRCDRKNCDSFLLCHLFFRLRAKFLRSCQHFELSAF